jgi:hypothetical protein
MRKAIALGVVALAAALSATFAVASGGHAAPKPGLASAVGRTEAAPSERYAIHVRIVRSGTPLSLHIRGQASRRTVSVKLRMSDLKLDDGTVVPGPDGAALLDGGFLYERAPSNLAVQGDVQWLRLTVAALPPQSDDMVAVRSMTPVPLLRVLRAAHIARTPEGARAFHGTIAYDAAAMRRLSKLTGDIEFRNLRVSALVGRDGLVHRIVLTGRTADKRTTFSLRAQLFAFGKPVHVIPPKPGTFMDERLEQVPS